jgi:hypothetical protein
MKSKSVLRHPWRFYPASTSQFTAASKGECKSKTKSTQSARTVKKHLNHGVM